MISTEQYRGWEIIHSDDRNAIAIGYEFDAYFGGCDLDARRISGRVLAEVKEEIDTDCTERAWAILDLLDADFTDAKHIRREDDEVYLIRRIKVDAVKKHLANLRAIITS